MLSQCRAVERVVVHRALGRNGLDEVIVSDLLVAERTVRETELQVVDGAAQRFEERLLADAVGRRERKISAAVIIACLSRIIEPTTDCSASMLLGITRVTTDSSIVIPFLTNVS